VSFYRVILFCAVYAICNVSGAALIKTELKHVELKKMMDYVGFMLRYKVIAGFAIVFLSAIVLIKALSIAKISLVNPIATGLNFILTLAMGYLMFQEKLTIAHYIGMVCILAGILIITTAEGA